MNNMEKKIDYKNLKKDFSTIKEKSISAKNLTASVNMADIVPNEGRILVRIKAWPAQSEGGILTPNNYTIIRGEQYITQIEKVADNVSLVKEGDVAIVSMYSGFHVATKTGHAKILNETDVLAYKTGEEMNKNLNFNPETFEPGVNYILIELDNSKEVKTEAGIIASVDSLDTGNKNDSITKQAKVLKVGPTNDYGKQFKAPNVGDKIIIDSFVGIPLNNMDVKSKKEYRIMYLFDVLGFIK